MVQNITNNIYSKTYDWSDFIVKESKKGYIIEYNCRVQGGVTNRKVLIRFSSNQFCKGIDLNKSPINVPNGKTWGEIIYDHRDLAEVVLRKGIEVR